MNLFHSGAGLALSLVAAVIPTVLYVLFIRWLDRYEKEPLTLAAAAFLWGSAPAVILSIIAELILGIPFSGEGCTQLCIIVQSAAIAPVVEEVVKAIALLGLVLFFRHEFDGVLDGVIYGTLVGFGFAMTENFLYFIGSFAEGGWDGLWMTVVLRSGAFGLTHAFFSGLVGAGIGYGISQKPGSPRHTAPMLALAGAIGFHALHNFGVSIAAESPLGFGLAIVNYTVGVLLLTIIVISSLIQQKRWIANELRDEIGVAITQGEYDLITRKRYLAAKKSRPLARMGGQRVLLLAELSHLATELAFNKRQVRSGNNSRKVQMAMAQIRAQIAELRDVAAETLADPFRDV
jgi:protease PrsW